MTHFTCTLILSTFLVASFNLHAEIDSDSILYQLPDSLRFSELDEITVVGKRPESIIRADRISYFPNSLASGNQSNLYDALSAIPGIRIDSGGEVTANGIQALTIEINGRKSILTGKELLTYLRSVPVTNIEKIEVISFGGARTEGSDPIVTLNIMMRERREEGYMIGANIDGKYGRARQFYGSVTGGYSINNHSIDLSYSSYLAHNPSDLKTDRPYLDYEERLTQEYSRFRTDNNQHLSATYDTRPLPDIAIGLSVNYNFFKRREYAEMTTVTPFVENPAVTANHSSFATSSIFGGIYARRNQDSGCGNWMIACDFFRHKDSESQLMENNLGSRVDGTVTGATYGVVGTADWNKSLSSFWKLSSGVRVSYVSMDRKGCYTDDIDSGLSPDLSLSLGSEFGYSENVNVIYAEGIASYGSVNAVIGIRAEQSNLKNVFSGNESAGSTDFSRHFIHFYPSLSLTISPSGKGSWMFFYSNRVKRPRFADLDPFIHLFDDITHVGGNINLKESISHSLNMIWADNRRLRVTLSGETTSGEIVRCFRELTDRIVYVTPENLPRHLQALLSVSGTNIQICRWWSISAVASFVWSVFEFPQHLNLDANVSFSPVAEFTGRFSLSSTATAEIKALYYGSSAFGQARLAHRWNTRLAANKTFLGGRLALSVYIDDLFDSCYRVSTILLNGRKAILREKEYEEMRKAGVALSYNFNGGIRNKNKNSRNSLIDELNRVNL